MAPRCTQYPGARPARCPLRVHYESTINGPASPLLNFTTFASLQAIPSLVLLSALPASFARVRPRAISFIDRSLHFCCPLDSAGPRVIWPCELPFFPLLVLLLSSSPIHPLSPSSTLSDTFRNACLSRQLDESPSSSLQNVLIALSRPRLRGYPVSRGLRYLLEPHRLFREGRVVLWRLSGGSLEAVDCLPGLSIASP